MNTDTPKRSRRPAKGPATPFGSEYQPERWGNRNSLHALGGELCCVCGRPVRRDHKWVLLNHTDSGFPKPGDNEDDLSLYAVGPECLKRCPAEFVRPPFEDQLTEGT